MQAVPGQWLQMHWSFSQILGTTATMLLTDICTAALSNNTQNSFCLNYAMSLDIFRKNLTVDSANLMDSEIVLQICR